MSKRSNYTLLSLFVFILIIIFIIILIIFSSRDGDKKNQKKVTDHLSIYSSQAEKICKDLNKSLDLYKNNSYEKASKLVEDSYWNIYDNILEIQYRSYATPSQIFQIEENFHELSKNMKIPYSTKQFDANKSKVLSLCKEMRFESKLLNKSLGGK